MLIEELRKLEKWLKGIIQVMERFLKLAPSEELLVRNNGHKFLFFQKKENEINKIPDEKCLTLLANKRYYKKALKAAKKELWFASKLEDLLNSDGILNSYYKLCPRLRSLITPFKLNDDDYAEAWQNVKFQGLGFKNDDVLIVTDRGERVRSKTEALIANKLNSLGIPYRYEYPIIFDTNIIYPDFTILNKKTRKEFVLEHFGMMDNETYRKNFFLKMSTYSKLGYVLGENLLMTFEDSKNSFDVGVFSEMIKRILGR